MATTKTTRPLRSTPGFKVRDAALDAFAAGALPAENKDIQMSTPGKNPMFVGMS